MRIMAISRNKIAVLFKFMIMMMNLILISSLTFLPSKSDGLELSGDNKEKDEMMTAMLRREKMLGSRPPECQNKCFSCRPCMATLVIPPHDQIRRPKATATLLRREDDTYYLLLWKCICGNKVFHP